MSGASATGPAVVWQCSSERWPCLPCPVTQTPPRPGKHGNISHNSPNIMMSTSAAVLCAVVLVMLPTAEAASAKKLYSWGEVLSRCGSDARDDHPAEGAVCMTHFNNATKDFSPCEEGYCTCTGSVWNATSRTCDTSTSTCGVSCKCMEKCYASFMSCTFGEIYRYFDTAECIKSEIKECVKDSEEQFVDECKRGVKDGRISWMESPLSSTDCDEELVCAGGTFSPLGLLSVCLTLFAVLLS